jgi:hypothetical protein
MHPIQNNRPGAVRADELASLVRKDPVKKIPLRVSGSRPPDSVNKVKVLPAITEFFGEGVSPFEHNHYDHNQGLPRGLE